MKVYDLCGKKYLQIYELNYTSMFYLGYKSKKYLHIVVVVYTKNLYKKFFDSINLNARMSKTSCPPLMNPGGTPPYVSLINRRFYYVVPKSINIERFRN